MESNIRTRDITRYNTEEKIGESENAIERMTALRWEPTHVTKHISRSIPLQLVSSSRVLEVIYLNITDLMPSILIYKHKIY